MATRQGVGEEDRPEEYSRPRQGGIIGITLDEGDALIDVVLTQAGRRDRAVAHARAWRSASARPTPARWAAIPAA